ncbi:MAG: hypothetical protein GY782_07950 [Gammaproteobacteria bacterium]|nr:hypothetical protein [Gammaproteobacteria bacterium]
MSHFRLDNAFAKDKLALLLPWRDTLYDALACGDIKFANFYINSVLEEKNFSWQEKVSLFFDVLKKDKRWLEFYVVRWDGKTPSPSGEHFSIITVWNTSTVHIASTI